MSRKDERGPTSRAPFPDRPYSRHGDDPTCRADILADAVERLAWAAAVAHLRAACGVDVAWAVPPRDPREQLLRELRVAWVTADAAGRREIEQLAAKIIEQAS